jgi:uncharacterized protein
MMTVRKLTATLLLLLAFSGCTRAPETASPPASDTASATAGDESTASIRPILYVVRGKGEPSLLMGTIHVGVSAKSTLGEAGLAAVTKSRILLTELSSDIDQALVASAMMLPKERSLRAILGEDRFASLSARITSVPPIVVDRLAPWAAMVQAGMEDMKRLSKARGGDASAMMDNELQTAAALGGVPNVGLEAVEDQLSIFTTMDQALVLKLIDEATSEKGQASVGRLYDAYLAGDGESLLALTLEDIEDAPELYERLLPARNKAWMKTLVPELVKGRAFVAVGAAHLFGDDGLIALLRREGFTVERATPADY